MFCADPGCYDVKGRLIHLKKMNKVLALTLALALVFSLAACSGGSSAATATPAATATATPAPTAEGYEIALVTDVGNIDDKSFNEGAWTGVKNYAEANKITYAYYRPSEDSTEARVETMKDAISKGAKVIVCPGYLFEDAVYEMQTAYPDIMFLLLDGEPHTPDYATYETTSNTHCILYKEEQAGYLAGYAAVMDGYTKLGFLGGMAVPAVVRYGYGYVQGADAAAKELGLKQGDIEIKYWYSGVFAPSDDIKTKMDGWYTEGTEVIFSCGGGIYLSCVAAAEAAGAKVIGVDVDQSAQSDLIITSAMKALSTSVELALTSLYANGGTWDADHAGITAKLGAAENCIGLPTAEGSWKLQKYTVAEYEALYAKLKDGSIVVDNSSDVNVTPVTTIAVVDYQG